MGRTVSALSPCCSLFMNTEEEYIPDSESVRQQRELHHQPQTCTLSQCFQLYTKEEQVGARKLGLSCGGALDWSRVAKLLEQLYPPAQC